MLVPFRWQARSRYLADGLGPRCCPFARLLAMLGFHHCSEKEVPELAVVVHKYAHIACGCCG
eukprot:9815265-Alexandrium_andersonii.AAC.1